MLHERDVGVREWRVHVGKLEHAVQGFVGRKVAVYIVAPGLAVFHQARLSPEMDVGSHATPGVRIPLHRANSRFHGGRPESVVKILRHMTGGQDEQERLVGQHERVAELLRYDVEHVLQRCAARDSVHDVVGPGIQACVQG